MDTAVETQPATAEILSIAEPAAIDFSSPEKACKACGKPHVRRITPGVLWWLCSECQGTSIGRLMVQLRRHDLAHDPLTSREWDVIRCVALGLSNKLIGHRLGLTMGTIKVYLSRIFQKTGADNRTELALMFANRG